MSAHTATHHVQEQKARSFAIIAYVAVFVCFVSLCAFAVTMTMKMEKEKTTFQQIEVTAPISFIDRTYLKEDTAPIHPE